MQVLISSLLTFRITLLLSFRGNLSISQTAVMCHRYPARNLRVSDVTHVGAIAAPPSAGTKTRRPDYYATRPSARPPARRVISDIFSRRLSSHLEKVPPRYRRERRLLCLLTRWPVSLTVIASDVGRGRLDILRGFRSGAEPSVPSNNTYRIRPPNAPPQK